MLRAKKLECESLRKNLEYVYELFSKHHANAVKEDNEEYITIYMNALKAFDKRLADLGEE